MAAALTGGAMNGAMPLEEVMVLRFRTKVPKDCLLPIPLHIVPVLYLAVMDGLVAIARCLGIGNGLITDEEVEVLGPTFG